MASELAAYYVSIVGSARGLSKSIGKEFAGVESQASRTGRSSGKSFADAFKAPMAGIAGAFAAVGIGSFVKDAVNAAGSLEQSVGAISSVFGASAKDMNKWSRDAAKSVGLTSNEFNELGTLIGAQLKNGGTAMEELAPKTKSLITMGADLSSMFGGTTKDAVDALSSALKGERDPIERYGVSLNQAKIDAEAAALGFEKVDGALSAEASQAATLSLIMKQTADAHGNFAKESDTFAHKQQVASAQWGDLTTKIGELFLPVFSGAMSFFSEKALPVITEITGGIRAFGAAWAANDGDITSSGFPGFMEGVAYQGRQLWDAFNAKVMPVLKQVGEYIKTSVVPALQDFGGYLAGTVIPKVLEFGRFLWDNRGAILAVGAGIAAYVVTMKTMAIISTVRGWLTAAAAAQWGLNAAMTANPIGLVIAGIAALVAGLVWFFTQTDVGKKIVADAWEWIQGAIRNVVDWFNKTAMPIIQQVIRVVGSVFTWLYENVIRPVWNNIKTAVNAAWLVMEWIFTALVAVVQKVIAPAFQWLYRTVIKPAFDGIAAVISWVWNNVLKPVFNAIWGFINNTLGPIFNWLWKNVIKPVWDGIGAAIKWVWDKVVKPVFDTLSSFITKTIPKAFEDGVGFIKKAWEKIQEIAKAPVRFVINTVINDGLIAGLNGIGSFLGLKALPKVALPPGFAHGGYTGDGGKYEAAGVVHKGEYVFTKEQTAAIGKDRLAEIAALGSPMPGSLPFIQGPLQNTIARTGRLNLLPHGGFPISDLMTAAQAWNGRAGVSLAAHRYGGGSNQNVGGGAKVYVGYGGMPAGTLGFYQGNQIAMSRNNSMQRETIIHEVGHALGIHHNTGNTSIMHPMLRGGGAVWPSAYDTANLRRLYGGPGSGAQAAADPGGAGGSFNPIEGIIDGLVKKFKETFTAGGFIADIAIGIGKKLLTSASDWVGSKLGMGDGAAATLYDGGGWLKNTGGAQLVQHNKRKPDAVLSHEQWSTMSRIAENSAVTGPRVEFTGPVHVRDENELARIIQTKQMDALAVYV